MSESINVAKAACVKSVSEIRIIVLKKWEVYRKKKDNCRHKCSFMVLVWYTSHSASTEILENMDFYVHKWFTTVIKVEVRN